MAEELFSHLLIFQGLSEPQLELLRPLFTVHQEKADRVLFEQGEAAEYLYIVVEGEMNIRYKPEDGPAIIVARVRPNGVIGWSAALGSLIYTSAVVCATDCILLRVRGQDLRSLYEQHPDTGKIFLDRLALAVSERMTNTHSHVVTLLQFGLGVGAGSR